MHVHSRVIFQGSHWQVTPTCFVLTENFATQDLTRLPNQYTTIEFFLRRSEITFSSQDKPKALYFYFVIIHNRLFLDCVLIFNSVRLQSLPWRLPYVFCHTFHCEAANLTLRDDATWASIKC